MPSNDTENIYATQYGGEGEPIPATKISYNNTISGLTADDAQEAIDEVSSDVGTVTSAFNTLKGKLDGNKVLKGIFSVSVTADGTKSFATLLGELNTAIKTAIQSIADNESVMIKHLYIEGAYGLDAQFNLEFDNSVTNVYCAFHRMNIGGTQMDFASITMFSPTPTYRSCAVTTTGATFTDESSNVPTASKKLTMYYEVWETV